MKLSLINTHDFVVYELLNAVSGYRGDSRFDDKDTMVSVILLLNLVNVFIEIVYFSWVSCTKPNQQLVTPPTVCWVGLGFRRGRIFLFEDFSALGGEVLCSLDISEHHFLEFNSPWNF